MRTTHRRALLAGTAIGLVLACGAGRFARAEEAAVSAPVLTVDGSVGSLGGSPSGFFSAAGTVPIGNRYGFQLDGQIGQSGERGQGGSAAHLFWRDPDTALVGATALWARIGGWNVFRYGAEAEAYLGGRSAAAATAMSAAALQESSGSRARKRHSPCSPMRVAATGAPASPWRASASPSAPTVAA
jgi:hypothetical protein